VNPHIGLLSYTILSIARLYRWKYISINYLPTIIRSKVYIRSLNAYQPFADSMLITISENKSFVSMFRWTGNDA